MSLLDCIIKCNEDYINEEHLYEMANLVKSKTGLPVDIWSEHKGVIRKVEYNSPRIKLTKDNLSIVISIVKNPLILARSPRKLSGKEAYRVFKDGIDYVRKNYDIFLNHYNDTDDSFDDEALFKALRERGVYK